MNDYPNLCIQRDGYAPDVTEGTNLSRGSDGTPWVQIMYSEARTTFQLIHPALTDAQAEELTQFYAANKRLRVRYVEPDTGDAYSVYMLHPPMPTARIGVGRRTYRMTLTGELLP